MAEAHLKPKIGKMKLKNYFLGYGESEALYFSEEYRVPNNVFPIFWWRLALDGESSWKPMFSGR